MKGVKNLKEKSEKIKMALGGYIWMIAAMKGVAAKRKVMIAKACATTVGLYGLETSAETRGGGHKWRRWRLFRGIMPDGY